jgi:hypothetical protein
MYWTTVQAPASGAQALRSVRIVVVATRRCTRPGVGGATA